MDPWPVQPGCAARPAARNPRVTPRVELGGEIGDYAIKDRIGEGGMGTVFLAEQKATGELVALKILQVELAEDQEFRRRFERESRYASSLNHPNITRLIEFGEFDGVGFMAMQYVPGHDLTVELAAGRIGAERTIQILEQVASALDAVHANGIFHRDVKPANILVNDDEAGSPHAWLTDFGLSKHPTQDSSPLTSAGFFVGTCQYVAPEQILADRDLDERVDVYSLGCVLYECLAGDPPFTRPREEQVLYAHIQDPVPKLSQVRPDLPPAIDGVIERALAKKPEDRYASCGELVTAAREALPAEAAPAPVESADCLRLRVTAGNASGSEIQIRDELVIGRQASEEGQLSQDAEISREHARIGRSGDHFVIEDLESTNGTFVNGRRITKPEILSPGDRIQVGATTLVVQVSVPSAAPPPASAPDADTRSSSHMSVPEGAPPEVPTELTPPPLSLRLDFDPATREVVLRLDEEGDSVRLIHEDGRWRLAPKEKPG
jgi:serine/threonine protein kinase